MKVTIQYAYDKNAPTEFNNVISIKQIFDYKLGARVDLKIEGKRNKIRIPSFDIQYMTISE